MAHLRVRFLNLADDTRFPGGASAWPFPLIGLGSQKVGATVGKTAAPISAASFGDGGTGADGLITQTHRLPGA